MSPTRILFGLCAVLACAACSDADDAVQANLGPSGRDALAAQLYADNCASCHDTGTGGAPTRAALEGMTINRIKESLTTGVMKQQGAALGRFDLIVLAEYLGRETPEIVSIGRKCEGTLDLGTRVQWGSWGGKRNTRLQPASVSRITPENVDRLELAWAFGFPGAQRARSQPAIVGNAIFTGSQSGMVYALDRETGCVWWSYDAGAEVRNAPLVGQTGNRTPDTLYFGDIDATVHAVDIATGKKRWSKAVKDHPDGTITGSIVEHDGTLFVPMSSLEVLSAYSDDYACCTFRGGIMALDAQTGKRKWRWFSVAEPKRVGTNSAGADIFAPSGAPVWSTPTIDAKRGLLYVGTGENYSSPANAYSDAIVALDMTNGRVRWAKQTIAGDAWNAACQPRGVSGANCPSEDGPDFDFGAPPILVTLANGKDMLLAGQKSGEVFGLDPEDKGRIVWRKRAGMGGFNGGIHWGMASDGRTLWVGIADTPGSKFAEGPPRPGIHAFDAATGKVRWSRIEPMTCEDIAYRCVTALSAPLSATPGLIFAGAHNGRLLAYSAKDGSVLWMDETNRAFETVNGVEGHGGTIDGAGAVVANGMLLVNSGYDKFGEIPGNVLLAYRIKEEAR